MKRFAGSLMVLALLCALTVPAFAVGTTTYRIEEADISIDIPDSYAVFTRDMEADDPNLSKYGLTKDDMLAIMQEQNLFLDALDESVDYELAVGVENTELPDYRDWSESDFSALYAALEEQFAELGITILKLERYEQHRQTPFTKIYASFVEDGSTVYTLQYNAIWKEKTVRVTLYSYAGEIDNAHGDMIKAVVDSVVFEGEAAESGAPEQPEIYIDESTGLRFTVPENWSQGELSEEREILKTKFSSNLESGLLIYYGSIDVWAEMDAVDKVGMERADIDEDYLSEEDLADALGVDPEMVSTVYYNGVKYCREKTVITTDAGITVPTIRLYRTDNGYIYFFQTTIPEDSPYYQDFEDLVSGVRYPLAPAPEINLNPFPGSMASPPPAPVKTTVGEGAMATGASLLLSVLLTILLHPLPIWIYRYCIRKKPVEPKKAKKIAIWDAVAVFFVILIPTVALGGSVVPMPGILVWGYVCYCSLKKGYEPETAAGPGAPSETVPESLPAQPAQAAEPQIAEAPKSVGEEAHFCDVCGEKLGAGAHFCGACGAKVPESGEAR